MIIADPLFIALFAAVLLLSMFLTRFSGFSLSRLSVPSYFLISYYVFAFIGIFPLYLGLDVNRYDVSDQSTVLMMFAYGSLALLLVNATLIFIRIALKGGDNDITQRTSAVAVPAERLFFAFLLAVSAAVFLKYLKEVPEIALFSAITSAASDAATARSKMGNEFEGKYWLYKLFFTDFTTLCALFFLSDYTTSRKRISLCMFLLAAATALFAGIVSIEKRPAIDVMIALYLGYIVHHGGKYWQSRLKYYIIPTVSAVFVALLCMFVFFMGQPVGSAFGSIFSRTFTGQIHPAYYYLKLFPVQMDYLQGASAPNPGGLLPFASFPLTTEISYHMLPSWYDLDVVGSAPTVFWAEAYANFGVAGVIVFSLLVGLLVYAVQYVFNRISKTPTVSAAFVLLTMHYADLAVTGPTYLLFDTKLFFILAATVIPLFLRSLPKPKAPSNSGPLLRNRA